MTGDREAVYRELVGRLLGMKTSDEAPVYKEYEGPLLEKVSALTDAVHHEIIPLPKAIHMLDRYIAELKPREGEEEVIRF